MDSKKTHHYEDHKEDEKESPLMYDNICTGQLLFEKQVLIVTMGWHLSHSTDKETVKDFFRFRCHAMRDLFGHQPGVSGYRMNDESGEWEDATLHRPWWGGCGVSMGYRFTNFDISKWEEYKLRFIDVFAPASLPGRGEVEVMDEPYDFRIKGVFTIPSDRSHAD